MDDSVIYNLTSTYGSGSDKGYKIYTHCCKSYSVEVSTYLAVNHLSIGEVG